VGGGREGGWGMGDGGLGMGGMGGMRGRGMGNEAWGAGVGEGGERLELEDPQRYRPSTNWVWERFTFVCLLFLVVIGYSYYL
jgi:hypothetical protein